MNKFIISKANSTFCCDSELGINIVNLFEFHEGFYLYRPNKPFLYLLKLAILLQFKRGRGYYTRSSNIIIMWIRVLHDVFYYQRNFQSLGIEFYYFFSQMNVLRGFCPQTQTKIYSPQYSIGPGLYIKLALDCVNHI